MVIYLVLGTRPQIIKSAPLVYESQKAGLDIRIIHTGQHYDYQLSKVLLHEFSLPDPILNLNVGSGTHAYQTANILLRLEKYLYEERPSLVIIPGDTNSALAGALAPVKLGISIAHLEAGARCYDMKMAEEINRRMIDHCSEILFAPTENCKINLENESVVGEIYQTGDTMYDLFIGSGMKSLNNNILYRNQLGVKDYSLLTLHRAENVNNPLNLKGIIKGILDSNINVIFPIHPRTRKKIIENNVSLENSNIKLIDPVSYFDMMTLVKNSNIVLTDSGGLQKEAFWSKIPCITIRDRTEWIETIEIGVNVLTDTLSTSILHKINYTKKNYQEIVKKFKHNPFGDGNASKNIVKILKDKI